ncbi:hypothetical protein [Budvicia aquatica]|uniref:hypothetical protein n=1 Tax=Budvicia aquatica TaxID=82979 RepID=UPI002082CDED|nr:hypothetical protein [Budvicia aquatica]GKX53836.1 hypothetical protein SOASR029_41450 [Budvicia aquatica]
MEEITPYSPFPYGFRGDKERGAYCEIDLGNGFTRFLVIYARAYKEDKERDEQLVSEGYTEWNRIYPEIEQLGYIPDENTTFWLYHLDICDIDKKYLEDSDSEIFAKNAINCKSHYFDDFYKIMDYVKEQYGVGFSDFHKDWETNYPQY